MLGVLELGIHGGWGVGLSVIGWVYMVLGHKESLLWEDSLVWGQNLVLNIEEFQVTCLKKRCQNCHSGLRSS